MEESRTKNSIKNISTGAVVQIINKVMAFVVRTVFIKVLNSEYLGVNGLFTNILTILSFAELGIGTAIIFNMYKPIAENDKEKIKSLMQLYKKSYNLIGSVVFFIGILIIPFMNVIVKDTPNIKENINCIYILFLLDTSLSYFFTYKKSIIIAHQKQSIINNVDSIFYLLKSLLQIIFLLLTKNFIVYLLIQIIGTFLENILLSIKANKLYPYLKEKDVQKLNAEENKNIFLNVKSLIVYKFGTVIMNGTDNILISWLINVESVGYVSNYVMIINSIKLIINSALDGITASIGNLNTIGEKKQKEKVFYQFTFLNYLIYSFCSVAFIVLLDPFIKLWLGSEYVLAKSVSMSLTISFFIEGLRKSGYIYRTAMGLFKKGKMTPYIGAITNIIFSILFAKFWGITGIFIATAIAQLVSYFWIDPYLIHKYIFETSFMKYIKESLKYFASFVVISVFTYEITKFIGDQSFINFIVKALIVTIVPNILNLVIFHKKSEFIELKARIKNIIKERGK